MLAKLYNKSIIYANYNKTNTYLILVKINCI